MKACMLCTLVLVAKQLQLHLLSQRFKACACVSGWQASRVQPWQEVPARML